MPLKYPLTLQAAQRGESALWALGDALRDECGEPGDDHSNNGSQAKIREAQAELSANGIERHFDTLRQARDISCHFPHGRRRPCVSFTVHAECGTPDMLDAVIALAGREDISKQEARELVQQVNQQRSTTNEAEHAAKHAAARAEADAAKQELAEAEEADRKADTLEGKREAKKRVTKAAKKVTETERQVIRTLPIPAGNPDAPLRRPTAPRTIYSDKLLNMALGAQVLASDAEKAVQQDDLLKLSKEDLGAQIEAALMAADRWRTVAQLMRERTGLKGAHLNVVGG